MTPEQKKHEEEYYASKKRYETAYADKIKYTREKDNAETKKQQLINSINAKKSERKKVKDAYDELKKTNGKDNDIDTEVKKVEKHLATAATQFKSIGTSSNGDQKDLEEVFSSNVTTSKKHISDAFLGIEAAKTNLSGRKDAIDAEITKLKGELETTKTNISKYTTFISQAEATMRTASVDMAYHKKYMNA